MWRGHQVASNSSQRILTLRSRGLDRNTHSHPQAITFSWCGSGLCRPPRFPTESYRFPPRDCRQLPPPPPWRGALELLALTTPDNQQLPIPREGGYGSSLARGGSSEAFIRTGCLFNAIDDADYLDTMSESNRHKGIRLESNPTQAGNQPQTHNRPQKRKYPHLTEKQAHPSHCARLEKESCVSRGKRKCRRLLRSSLPQHSEQSPLPPLLLDSPTARKDEHPPNLGGFRLEKHKARNKSRCRIGPHKQGTDDAENFHCSSIHGLVHKDEAPILEGRPCSSHPLTESLIRQTALSPPSLNPLLPIFPAPDRATPTAPSRFHGSPLDRYKASASTELELDPFRFTQANEQRVHNDIDELLTEIEHSRCQELLEKMPFDCALHKEDCLRLWNRHRLTTGSLLGMYLWDSDSDLDWERDDLHVIHAHVCVADWTPSSGRSSALNLLPLALLIDRPCGLPGSRFALISPPPLPLGLRGCCSLSGPTHGLLVFPLGFSPPPPFWGWFFLSF